MFLQRKKALVAAVMSLPLMLSTQVHAALPEGVTTAIDTAETDIVALLTALTATGVVIWVATIIYRRFTVK